MMATDETVEPQWPLSFRMMISTERSTSPTRAPTQFWSHEAYRGPASQRVRLFYSKTKRDSEAIASRFSHEKILGFDTEWKPYLTKEGCHPLQHRVSLIQIACEDQIALFHIGQHQGETPDDLIAPALKHIIESSDITKAGVGVKTAEYDRLKKYFKLEPRGFFELNHLHDLLTCSEADSTKRTRRLVGLATLVEQYLGLPLDKNPIVRVNHWDRLLSVKQKKYAAADAYAGFMLYHCMDARRMAMSPRPPLPIFVEQCSDQNLNQDCTQIQLRPTGTTTAAGTVTVNESLKPEPDAISSQCSSQTDSAKPRGRKRKRKEEVT